LKDTTPRDVIQWLATTKESWLLILDNCDDAEIDFARYIPSRGGSIIITTRLTECRNLGTWQNIDDLGSENATHLLLRASGLEDGDPETLIPAARLVVLPLESMRSLLSMLVLMSRRDIAPWLSTSSSFGKKRIV
jgi:hypothetical protein